MDTLLFSDEDQELIERSLTCLQNQSFEDAYIEQDEDGGLYCLYVKDEDFDEAKKVLLDFLKIELRDPELSGVDGIEPEESESGSEIRQESFQDLSEKYADTKSSAHLLIGFGCIGLIALLLEFVGIYTIPVASNVKPLFYATMLLMFAGFLIGGAASLRSAKKLKETAAEADKLTEDLHYFASHDIDAESIDSKIEAIDTLSQEDLYFLRTSAIRKALKENFPSANPAYQDAMAELVYQQLFD